METECVFCEIIEHRAPAEVRYASLAGEIIVPLNPVVPGHVIAISREHTEDFTVDLIVTERVMKMAANYARLFMGSDVNLITSKGLEATQSVFHLHVHLVPRRMGDGLHLPWTNQQKGDEGA